MKENKYSVLVIGSGLAGLFASLKIAETCQNADKILLITKSKLDKCNSKFAQGGIVCVSSQNTQDSTASHISDTIKAGAGLSDFNVVKFISENSENVINDVISHGVNFDKDENGKFYFTLEGAHSINRILHAGGDATGKVMVESLIQKVLTNPKIDIYENTMAVELLINENKECVGLISYNEEKDEYEKIFSSAVVLASGGLGQLYKHTTNPAVATGDGIALAYNAGAVLQDMEFIQFHPTALALNLPERNFLISESVRGEGAKLVHKNGERFMQKYHELEELAPRDVVARAIFNEMSEKNVENVYLDATVIPEEQLQKRFPTISKICGENGIDITKDYIPVFPAAHYFMGGVKVNTDARTSVKNLFAIGEVSSTGLHGANRLASNSLLECVVYAYQLSEYLKDYDFNLNDIDENYYENTVSKYEKEIGFVQYDVDVLKNELKDIMWENVSILRSEESLTNAQNLLNNLKTKFLREVKCLNIAEYEFKNMLINANLIVDSALKRKESRGAHYRTDYLNTNEVAEHSLILKEQGELVFVK